MVWTNYLDKQWRYRTLMTLFFQDDILLWSGHSAREMRPDWTSVVMPEQHWCCWSVEDFRSQWTQWQKKKNSFKFTDIMWKQAFSVGPFKTAWTDEQMDAFPTSIINMLPNYKEKLSEKATPTETNQRKGGK